ncbi:TPA: hypothetical protein ACFM69_000942 [Neisseria meningitidis]|nr:hypothetical protein [Neisseria meningitidis]
MTSNVCPPANATALPAAILNSRPAHRSFLLPRRTISTAGSYTATLRYKAV